MERSPIVPHISWSGPAPEREADAYLLAMILRIYASGLDFEDESKQDNLIHPSVLTTANLHMISTMYAFYKQSMDDAGVKTTEDMLKLVKGSDEDKVVSWIADNEEAIHKAEAELLEFVDTRTQKGLSAFG